MKLNGMPELIVTAWASMCKMVEEWPRPQTFYRIESSFQLWERKNLFLALQALTRAKMSIKILKISLRIFFILLDSNSTQ